MSNQLYHATTPKKLKRYKATGNILAPVRGFNTYEAAQLWATRVGRTIILSIWPETIYPLPDHKNRYGRAFWSPNDIKIWRVINDE